MCQYNYFCYYQLTLSLALMSSPARIELGSMVAVRYEGILRRHFRNMRHKNRKGQEKKAFGMRHNSGVALYMLGLTEGRVYTWVCRSLIRHYHQGVLGHCHKGNDVVFWALPSECPGHCHKGNDVVSWALPS